MCIHTPAHLTHQYMHLYIYTHLYLYIHLYAHTCTHTPLHTYTHTCIYTPIHITYLHTPAHIRTPVYTHTCTHTCTYFTHRHDSPSMLSACALFWHEPHPCLVNRGGNIRLLCFLEQLVLGRKSEQREKLGLCDSGPSHGGGCAFQSTHIDTVSG